MVIPVTATYQIASAPLDRWHCASALLLGKRAGPVCLGEQSRGIAGKAISCYHERAMHGDRVCSERRTGGGKGMDAMGKNTGIRYKHFFQQLIEALPWPILIIETDLQILHANQQVLLLFGLAHSPVGQKLEQLLDDEAMLRLVQACIQSGKVCCDEFYRARSGESWKISVTPVEHCKTVGLQSSSAEYCYFSLVIEDLSELRRLERVRRDFIANISHELRTPLASVSLLAETLEDTIDTDPEQAQIFVERIETEVGHLNELVAELLELSRIESGRLSMSIGPVESEMLVREIMARMLPQAQRHRVLLRTSIEQGQTLVLADSKQIARVLVNLVHNAIKFTPSGGTIIIGTRCQPESTMQSFFVRDSGIGIAPEDLSRIFERFYKVNPARSRGNFIGPGGGGSGLGLAIARHVVEAHAGCITAISEPGKGSTFTFTLPIDNRVEREKST
jgi:two-component system phosphate regulon sensor histidine kinase PhoR